MPAPALNLQDLIAQAYALADSLADRRGLEREAGDAYGLAHALAGLTVEPEPEQDEQSPEDRRAVLDFFHVPSLSQQAHALRSSIEGTYRTGCATGDGPTRQGALAAALVFAGKVARILEEIDAPEEGATS